MKSRLQDARKAFKAAPEAGIRKVLRTLAQQLQTILGADFSHVGECVTFEVVLTSFGLDKDPGLQRLGERVHFIDVGGIAVDDAPGLELFARGLQAQYVGADALLAVIVRGADTSHWELTPQSAGL